MLDNDNVINDNAAKNKNGPPPVNAEAVLTVKDSGLEALIKIKPPKNGGLDLTYDLLKECVSKNGITFGIIDNVLQQLARKPAYDFDFVVATGTPCKDGEDAELIYYIETNRNLKPKEKADGSVDFKELGVCF
jgi:uncharacterized protein (DUF342 family)